MTEDIQSVLVEIRHLQGEVRALAERLGHRPPRRERDLLSPREVAAEFRISDRTVARDIAGLLLPAAQRPYGRKQRWLIRRCDAQRLYAKGV